MTYHPPKIEVKLSHPGPCPPRDGQAQPGRAMVPGKLQAASLRGDSGQGPRESRPLTSLWLPPLTGQPLQGAGSQAGRAKSTSSCLSTGWAERREERRTLSEPPGAQDSAETCWPGAGGTALPKTGGGGTVVRLGERGLTAGLLGAHAYGHPGSGWGG